MSYRFDFGYILANGPALLEGLGMTVLVSVISIALAAAVGVVGAAVRVFRVPVLSQLFGFYVEFIRNTPLLAQLFFIFYGLPSLGLGLSVYWSGVAALTVWGGAYNVENMRGGFLAVSKGMREASQSLGLRPLHYLWLVAIPLGLRVAIPAMLNTSVSVLKNSSYLQAIGFAELTFVAMERVATEFRTLEMFAAIGVLYLVLVLILSFAVRRLEFHLQRPFRTS
ncbi:amino acid ABC transporter membrane protein 1 (PAAT family) [Stella humosa]|uniref:Amino acid ABC transporter membrane protein 1 (PAAT family) n=1 Tax=Stella humosa TaxID=94 RepID=A0A3N1KW96_9PROT|nr:amino acid ABC transporter permease [Stella humosa]ROP83702.1 amino acid ABC transporter membrane protein 1 (PAAT family) [Stella humosa]BBK33026.1 amino acid ABC transporter permease [Stella humosa]